MLKSPTISALSTLTNRSERKSADYFRKSVYGPGGLYTVARARDRTDLFCLSDSLTFSKSISYKYVSRLFCTEQRNACFEKNTLVSRFQHHYERRGIICVVNMFCS